jgi:hypothetical protein
MRNESRTFGALLNTPYGLQELYDLNGGKEGYEDSCRVAREYFAKSKANNFYT